MMYGVRACGVAVVVVVVCAWYTCARAAGQGMFAGFAEKYKHEAWSTLGDMAETEAKEKYAPTFALPCRHSASVCRCGQRTALRTPSTQQAHEHGPTPAARRRCAPGCTHDRCS